MTDERDSLQIKPLTDRDRPRWDAFVERTREATFFHRSGWKDVLERAFGLRTYFLYAEADGEIRGVLPLAHVRSRLFGNALVSTPFCVYGGSVGDSDAVCERLDAEACRLASELRVDHLERRGRAAFHPDWPSKDLYVTFRKAIDPEPEKNLLAIPRKQRAMVRKGQQAGLESRTDCGVDAVYDVYSESLRNLGTPVFTRRYFHLLEEAFGEDCEALTVHHQGRVVAGVLNFYFRDEVLPYYGGGVAEARTWKANDFMYWELMRRAAERGISVYDFGRSKRGTGSYDFKRNWGFEPQPLHYEYHLVRAREVPDVNPLNPKYRLFIETWKRLPVPVSRWLGPPLARQLG